MSSFLRRLLPTAARNLATIWKIPSRFASEVPIRKGPFWDAGWPYPSMHPWVDIWDDRQREHLMRMDRLLRVSPWRRLEEPEAQRGRREPGTEAQEFGPQSDINRITLDKQKLQLEVELNVNNYGPEDVFVNQTGDWLVVNAQHTVRADKYGYITRQLTRQIYIPEGLEKDSISGSYTETGNLVLSLKAQDEEGFKRAEKLYGDPKQSESSADPCSPCG